MREYGGLTGDCTEQPYGGATVHRVRELIQFCVMPWWRRGSRRTSGRCSAAPLPGSENRAVMELRFSKETLKSRGNVRDGVFRGSRESVQRNGCSEMDNPCRSSQVTDPFPCALTSTMMR